jgi:glycosyltransferase involved in cell wall biosynthesis
MRILMINHEFTITGASTVFLRMAAHFSAQGHDVEIFPLIPDDGPIKARYAALGIPVIASAIPARYDVAIANTICAAAAVIQVAGAVPTIWFIHETEIGLNILLKSPDLAKAFGLAAAIVYQTPFQAEVYRSFTYQLDPGKFHIVANGIDIAPDSIDRGNVAPKPLPLRVVQVGTVEPRKRPGDLIRAVALSGLAMQCVICGKVMHLEPEAMQLVEAEPEKYRLNGETPEPETLGWVESADMFCLASGSESQPVSVFEAALLARPLLLSDLPGYRNVFVHGRNCLMFPPGHIELLALSLRNYATSARLRADMGAAAQRTARRFSGAGFLSRFATVIDAVITQP